MYFPLVYCGSPGKTNPAGAFVNTEHQTIQLRAEAFNLPNHVNLSIPGLMSNNRGGNVTLTAPNFGQITKDISGNSGLLPGDYRVIQFALKLMF